MYHRKPSFRQFLPHEISFYRNLTFRKRSYMIYLKKLEVILKMKRIDLHLHSTFSDGTCSPTEIVQLAQKANLSAIALTDHDTTDGLDEFMSAGKKYGVETIPGIEISAQYDHEEVHIVGLFIDYTNPNLQNTIYGIQNHRIDRNGMMIEKLQSLGFSVTMDDLETVAQGEIITRAHFAKLLLQKGYVSSLSEAFDLYLSQGKPGYIQRKTLSPKETIQLIEKAGGIAVMAHPTLYNLTKECLETLIQELISYGLKGIEAEYVLYSEEEEAYIKSFADQYHLLYSGGSDFHGENKRDIKIGIGKGNLQIPYSYLVKMKKIL